MPHRRTLDRVSRPGLRFQGWRRLPAGSRIAVVILALIAAMAILAPVVAPYDPGDTGLAKIEHTVHVEGIGDTVISDTAVPPSARHLFGTDKPSRDIFSRAVYGARVSLVVGLSATGIALALAAVLGAVAATGRKWVGELVMRVLDVLMSFPGIALAAVLVLAMVKRLPVVPVIIIATAVVYTPS